MFMNCWFKFVDIFYGVLEGGKGKLLIYFSIILDKDLFKTSELNYN